jgi:flagellar hook protein FlgE
MSNTFQVSLSGMLAASLGLQNSSNNVSNMQSPGFKRSDVFYSSLGNSTYNPLGGGVTLGGNSINFSDGKHLSTNNPTDLAIVGNGFFVIKLKNGELVYTRNGEFEFNPQGILIDKHSSGEVQGYDATGHLVPIHAKGPQFCAGKGTRNLYLTGQFVPVEKSDSEKESQPGPFKSNYKNISFSVAQVYDNKGHAHEITLEFESTPVLFNNDGPVLEKDTGKSWDLVNITCKDAAVQFKSQQILFSSLDGSANKENSIISFTLNGNQPISLNFGDKASSANESVRLKESKTTPEGTKISSYQQDGYAEGIQDSFSFDDNGQISYGYDNGQTLFGIHIGLARFDDLEHTLVKASDNAFRAKHTRDRVLGRANQNGLGCIQSKQLESANVDSTTEFANIVVLQRMFQSCSQIMNIDKELLEGLYKR